MIYYMYYLLYLLHPMHYICQGIQHQLDCLIISVWLTEKYPIATYSFQYLTFVARRFSLSIIALVKVTILLKSSGLDPFDHIIETLGFGTAGHGYAAGAEYGGYGRYDPTEYVHHAPQPVEHGHQEEYGHHAGHVPHQDLHHDVHGDVAGYAGYASKRSQNVHQSTGDIWSHTSTMSTL